MQEIVVDPRSGQWYTVGDNGAEFRDIPKGAIVFNHLQSKMLLSNGYAIGRATALASGTAMLTGGISIPQTKKPTGSTYTQSSSSYSSSSYSSSSRTSGGNSSSKDDEKKDWIEVALKRIEKIIEDLSRTAKSSYRAIIDRLKANNSQIVEVVNELDIRKQAYDRYMTEANSVDLSSDIKDLVQKGKIDITKYKKETQELISEYEEWYEKAVECDTAIKDLKETLGDLYSENFDNVNTEYENQLSLLEHLTNAYDNSISYIEERGYIASSKLYEAQRSVEEQNLAKLKEELQDLTEQMSNAINSGYVDEGSEKWYEFQSAINDVKETIQETETEIVKLNNSIRELAWDNFDYAQDKISELADESDFLISLLGKSDLFEDSGKITSNGLATIGLHAESYNVFMSQADMYAKEIKKVNAELANDPNNTKLIDRLKELRNAQQDVINSAYDERDAMVSVVKDGIDKQLSSLKDLIDEYNDAVSSSKDLYDYQKKVKEQTEKVANLEKQLSAYSRDDSAETRATVQKLKVELEDAKSDLQETEYERMVSDQKEMLDDVYNEYEKILNDRMDDTDALIKTLIDATNENHVDICDAINDVAEKVGYSITEETASIWADDGLAGSIVSEYGDKVSFGITSIASILEKINRNVSSITGYSDTEASSSISNTTATTDVIKPVTPPEPEVVEEPVKEESNEITDEIKRKVAAAIWRGSYGWGKGSKKGSERYDKLVEVFGENNGIQDLVNQNVGKNDHTGLSDYSYKAMRMKFKGYKTGGIVDYTGLAAVHGSYDEPEAFLDAKDTKNFTQLRDAMRDVANGTSPLSSLFGNKDNNILGHISTISDAISDMAHSSGDIIYQTEVLIDHVEDYDDLVNKMRDDTKFEQMIQSMTIDRVSGKSRLSKNKHRW